MEATLLEWLDRKEDEDDVYLNDMSEIPNQVVIENIYPNPFNPVSNIAFNVSSNTNVSINILDIQGRLVKSVINQDFQSGNYDVQINASDLSSGIYFIELILVTFVQRGKKRVRQRLWGGAITVNFEHCSLS